MNFDDNLDSKMANGYTTDKVGKLLSHLQKHEPLNFLPYHLVARGAIIPENLLYGGLSRLRFNTTQKARQANQMFITKLLDLENLEVGFTPVRVEIEGQVYKSEFTDFYRSFALYDKYMQFNWNSLCNSEPVAKMYIDRLLKLGNSKGAEIIPFFERESPLHDGYEVMTFIKKLSRFAHRSADQN